MLGIPGLEPGPFSSARQVEESHGLESQATRCREYAERKGYALNPAVIAAYEKRIAQLEQEKLVLAEKAASIDVPPLPFEKMFELVA